MMIQTIINFVVNIFVRIWDAALAFVSTILQFFVDVLSIVLEFLMWLIVTLIKVVLLPIPNVPDLPAVGPVPALFSTANYFVPFDVAFICLAVVATVYLAGYAVKFAKFMRGAG